EQQHPAVTCKWSQFKLLNTETPGSPTQKQAALFRHSYARVKRQMLNRSSVVEKDLGVDHHLDAAFLHRALNRVFVIVPQHRPNPANVGPQPRRASVVGQPTRLAKCIQDQMKLPILNSQPDDQAAALNSLHFHFHHILRWWTISQRHRGVRTVARPAKGKLHIKRVAVQMPAATASRLIQSYVLKEIDAFGSFFLPAVAAIFCFAGRPRFVRFWPKC